MGAFANVSPEHVQKMLHDSVVLIDVRADREVQRGLIPGAKHIPLQMLAARLAEIPLEHPVILYCQSGARSAQASSFLSDNGCREVYNLAGGFSAWVAQGFPVGQKS